jgi:uncharacterized protein with HEPN domain
MKKDDSVYLRDMLERARKVQKKIAGVSREQFNANEDLNLVVTFLLQTIGEGARHVSPETRRQYPGIPWEAMTSMRHRLVHDYMGIDLNMCGGPRRRACRN